MKRLHVVVAQRCCSCLPFRPYPGALPIADKFCVLDYGSGNYWADVTQRVASMLRRDSLNFRVDNATLGIDPAPRQPKTLRLEIRNRDGQVEQQTYQENEFVHLRGYSIINASFNGLQIFRGVYGDGRRQMDVTDRLNSQIQDGQLSLPVTSDTLGGDPAPGRRKTLTVDYSLNGGSGQMVLNEGDFLNLPVGYRRDDRRDERHADHRADRDRDPRGPQPPDNMEARMAGLERVTEQFQQAQSSLFEQTRESIRARTVRVNYSQPVWPRT